MAPTFTAAQWKELQTQAMIYKYMLASLPVPYELLFPIIQNHSPLTKQDLEPGRCKRTDGKKWRCSRDVAPNHKYCDRHMHRGRPRSRKHVEPSQNPSPFFQPSKILHHRGMEAGSEQQWRQIMHASRSILNNDFGEVLPHFLGCETPTRSTDKTKHSTGNLAVMDDGLGLGPVSVSCGGPLAEVLRGSNPTSPYPTSSPPGVGVLQRTMLSLSEGSPSFINADRDGCSPMVGLKFQGFI